MRFAGKRVILMSMPQFTTVSRFVSSKDGRYLRAYWNPFESRVVVGNTRRSRKILTGALLAARKDLKGGE